MSTTLDPAKRSHAGRRWYVLAVACLAGAGMSVATALQGEVVLAVVLPVIVIGYGLAVTLFARRSDVAAQLSGNEDDERRQLIYLKASSASGSVVMLAVVAGLFVELARGDIGGPFAWLAGAGGFSFMAASAYFSRRG
ncbi:hypothetical protein OG216_38960 [Streptomycetaceae bacterium NBC_01309]